MGREPAKGKQELQKRATQQALDLRERNAILLNLHMARDKSGI